MSAPFSPGLVPLPALRTLQDLSQLKNKLIGKREVKLELLRSGQVSRCVADPERRDLCGTTADPRVRAASPSSCSRSRNRVSSRATSRYRQQRSSAPSLSVRPPRERAPPSADRPATQRRPRPSRSSSPPTLMAHSSPDWPTCLVLQASTSDPCSRYGASSSRRCCGASRRCTSTSSRLSGPGPGGAP